MSFDMNPADEDPHAICALEIHRLQEGIRKIRDTRGDDRCWKDYETLFAMLPEGYASPARDTEVELENCRQYIRACRDPSVTYVSPQREIERLQQFVALVADMRAAQQAFFRVRSAEHLAAAKRLEKEVDAAVKVLMEQPATTRQGFCCICGIFSASIESFDFMHPGCCDNCRSCMTSMTTEKLVTRTLECK